ncbi:MAG: ABC transporter ATP-binding protein [Deltaproteobacteria bacterium]|nr:ABC transporter ATP-binding protein [Deltaproteobacteria bacterium]
MATAIEIQNLNKRYGAVAALDEVSLSIDHGEFLVLLGPSGCGKTTLLRSIAGFERPDSGEIAIGGAVVFAAARGIMTPPGERQVGMVFQSYALWPHMKVRDNIGFGLTVKHISARDAERRVDEVLRELSMEGLGDRYPSELSGGQQQRVALARLLATKPSVFLMDEPLSNLDARLRLDMRSEIKRIHHESAVTTLYVTHDQTEAMTMASHIVVMNKGRIQQIGTPNEIYRKPANLFVAEFVGMPGINLLPARALTADGGHWLEADDFRLPAPWLPPKERVIISTRPEDITIHFESQDGALEFMVYAVQPTGPETFVQLKRGQRMVIARETRPVELHMNQKVWLTIDLAAANLFDEDTGRLLSPEA